MIFNLKLGLPAFHINCIRPEYPIKLKPSNLPFEPSFLKKIILNIKKQNNISVMSNIGKTSSIKLEDSPPQIFPAQLRTWFSIPNKFISINSSLSNIHVHIII